MTKVAPDQPIQSAPFPDEGPDIHIGSNGPECPHCGSTTSAVKDSRPYRAERAMTRRRRQCATCATRFTTYESTIQLLKLPPALRWQLQQVKALCETLLATATREELP